MEEEQRVKMKKEDGKEGRMEGIRSGRRKGNEL